MEYISRNIYLQKLIDSMNNQEVKIITGARRTGKSWLLNHVFYDYLLSQGVEKQNIICISFDIDDDDNQTDLLDGKALKEYLYSRIVNPAEQYYVMLDEVQEVDGFERIINGLNSRENVDVYITGSNSHFLSSDINTIFRGRGDEIHIYPLSFNEFCEGRTEQKSELWKEYYTYGGLPGLRNHRTAEQKTNYLQRLWKKTYIADVVDRNNLKNISALEALADVICSSIGSLTNPTKLSNTIQTVMKVKVDRETVSRYIHYLTDAYIFEGAARYDIKGKRYFDKLQKYYATDIGLRNARLNFRQQEITHIMENVIYNHLRIWGYLVDVGVVEKRTMVDGVSQSRQLEVDFIATNGQHKYYIQSAYHIDSEQKREQELQSLLNIDDSFRKIVIMGDDIATYTDDHGITYIGLMDFLSRGLPPM